MRTDRMESTKNWQKK